MVFVPLPSRLVPCPAVSCSRSCIRPNGESAPLMHRGGRHVNRKFSGAAHVSFLFGFSLSAARSTPSGAYRPVAPAELRRTSAKLEGVGNFRPCPSPWLPASGSPASGSQAKPLALGATRMTGGAHVFDPWRGGGGLVMVFVPVISRLPSPKPNRFRVRNAPNRPIGDLHKPRNSSGQARILSSGKKLICSASKVDESPSTPRNRKGNRLSRNCAAGPGAPPLLAHAARAWRFLVASGLEVAQTHSLPAGHRRIIATSEIASRHAPVETVEDSMSRPQLSRILGQFFCTWQ